MNEPTPEQLQKLPKWAQVYITSLKRQASDATREREEYLDDQTESPFFEEFVGEGNRRVRYIQAHSLACQWKGVKLTISAHSFGQSGPGIRLQWGDIHRGMSETALIPESFQSARIVSKENMR